MSYRYYIRDWNKKPWAWKQGWLSRERDIISNPHKVDTEKYEQFEEGAEVAEFYQNVNDGYFDWDRP